MPKKWITLLWISINISLIGGFIIYYIIRDYPLIGHDYFYFIPRIIDTYLYEKINGFSIQWYSPSFGGGLPAYPNPQNIQFTLPQLLTLVFHPLVSLTLTILVYIVLGFWGTYHLHKNILTLDWKVSILGASLFLVNGFYIEHLSVGHIGYIAFPLLIWLLIPILDQKISVCLASVLFSITIAVLIYGAGFYLIIIFLFSILLAIPLLYLFQPYVFLNWKRICYKTILGVIVSVFLTGSKLSAVASFMYQFPREIWPSYTLTFIKDLPSIPGQLLGVMTLEPIFMLSGKNDMVQLTLRNLSGTSNPIWEMDVSISPVLILLLFIGVYFVVKSYKRVLQKINLRNMIAVFVFGLSVWISVEFILGHGLIFPYLHKLPFIGSLYISRRYTAAFIFPLSLLGTFSLDHLLRGIKKNTVIFSMILNLFIILAVASYLRIDKGIGFDVSSSNLTYDSIRTGSNFPVRTVEDMKDDSTIVSSATNIHPYEPIFGYDQSGFTPEIVAGDVYLTDGEYLNMTNPAGYVFPTINNTRPYERIKVSQDNLLLEFLQRKQTDLKRPIYQHIADWTSVLTFSSLVLIGFYLIVKKIWLKRVKHQIS